MNKASLYCRPGHGRPDEALRVFLTDAFSSDFVYIVSPWITNFRLRSRVVAYPYISSNRLLDVVEKLAESGKRVTVVTRCFNDFIPYDIIYFMVMHDIGASKIRNEELLSYLGKQVSDLKNRIESYLKIVEMSSKYPSIVLRTDVENKLHSKIYLIDRYALMGSANLTGSGMNWNYECLTVIGADTQTYSSLLKYAEELANRLKSFGDCEEAALKAVEQRTGLRLNSVKDLLNLLDRLSAVY